MSVIPRSRSIGPTISVTICRSRNETIEAAINSPATSQPRADDGRAGMLVS
jgi:hypothetical protein